MKKVYEPEQKSEIKKEEKKSETPVVKPKKKVRWGCYFLILLGVLLLISGIVLGIWAYPRAYNWLQRHNFISVQQAQNATTPTNTNVILSEENAVINAVESARSGVVSIAVSNVQLGNGAVVDKASKIGSGFVVDENGIVITNQHVVSDLNKEYVVITADGKEHKVTTVTRDDLNDIAILKVDAKGLTALKLGDSDKLQIGQMAIAIGTPLGEYAGSVTTGIVSGLHRSVTATSGSFWGQAKDYEDVIQTDAAINPGNSGGPLLNSAGEVIGVNFATTSSAANISFALPINQVKVKLDEYRKYGKLIKPFLGVSYTMISEIEAKYYKLAQGALVDRVGAGTPAEKGGVKVKDIIMSVNGQQIVSSLQSVLQKFKVGEEVTLKVWRDGAEVEIKVTLGEGS